MFFDTLRSRLNRLTMRRNARQRQRHLRTWYAKTFKRCPLCAQGSTKGHLLKDIASSSQVSSQEDRQLEELVRGRKWEEASAYQHANAPNDIRTWTAIKCQTGRISIVPVILTIELWDDDIPGEPIVLSEAESVELDRFVAERWEAL